MLLGSWVDVGNILFYKKECSIPIYLYDQKYLGQSVHLNSAQAYTSDRSNQMNQISLDKSVLHFSW